MNQQKKLITGFTLIELGVVITVIGLIVSAVIFSLSSARANVRDTQRLADVTQVQTALEAYRRDEGSYPSVVTFGQALVGPASGVTYMAATPVDPLNSSNYTYVYQAAGSNPYTSYSIFYTLEEGTANTQAGVSEAVPGTLYAQCVPTSCSGKTCGTDGCGTSCGTCTGINVCSNGTCVPDCGSGTFYGGSGTVGDPYQICSCAQLQNMNTALSANYVLVANVDCSASSGWNSSKGFIPVGRIGNADDVSAAFSGTLDGAGYTIDGLAMNRTTNYTTVGGGVQCGIFGGTSAATISNLKMTNTNITCLGNVGALAGYTINTTISKISVIGGTVSVAVQTGSGGSVGGILGNMKVNVSPPSSATLSNSYSSATISLGGSGGWYAGGLIGYSNGPVSNVYASGNVSGNATAQGIGGLIGAAGSTIANAFSTGNVTGGSGYVGGLSGSASGSVFSNAYWSDLGGNSSLSCYNGGNTGCTKVSATAEGDLTHFYNSSSNAPMSSWNFSTIWQTTSTYPTLR